MICNRFRTAATAVACAAYLTGCGGGGGDGDDENDNRIITTPVSDRAISTYTDNFIRTNYPAEWTLNTSLSSVSAQFLAPEQTATGGNPNCTVDTVFEPGSTLTELTERTLTLFNTDPEPVTNLVTVNGVEMTRSTGTITLFTFKSDATQQVAYEDDYFHTIVCFSTPQADTDLVLDSMELL